MLSLPYLPNFFYAAFETSEDSQDVSVAFFNSEPADLRGNFHFMDGFKREVQNSINIYMFY